MSDIAEGCFRLIIEVVLTAGWKVIQGGSWFSLPVIVFFVAVSGTMLFGTTVPILQTSLSNGIELSADDLLIRQFVQNSEQEYHVNGSAMTDIGYQATTDSSYYGLLHVGTRDLLIISPTAIDERQTAYKGHLTAYVDESTLETLLDIVPEAKTSLLPVYFTIPKNDVPLTVVLLLIQGGLILLTGYAIKRFVLVTLLKQE